MKYLLTFALLYLAYRYFFNSSNAIEGQEQNDEAPSVKYKARGAAKDDEYVDYEEVE